MLICNMQKKYRVGVTKKYRDYISSLSKESIIDELASLFRESQDTYYVIGKYYDSYEADYFSDSDIVDMKKSVKVVENRLDYLFDTYDFLEELFYKK